MSFWTSTALEPKRQFRFRLTITAVDGEAAIWFAKKVTVPAFTVGEVKHSLLIKHFTIPDESSGTLLKPLWLTPLTPMQLV